MFRKVMSNTLKGNLKLKNVRFNVGNTADIQRTEKSINLVTLLGRTGSAPVLRGSEEHKVVIFPVATQSHFKSQDELLQRVEWHRVAVFKPSLRDSIYTFLRKGQRVWVQGKLSYGEYKDDEGNTKFSTTIIADEVIFFGNKEG